jgi:hypothetical protein
MSTSGKVRLTAVALDNAAEIFLIDSKLDRVARGIGRIDTSQPPGVYKLKLRAGQATHEELVVLHEEPVHRVLDHLQIPSAAPLDRTAQSHEYHQRAALRESRKARVTLGAGASIFVFARDWTPQGAPPHSGHHPAEKLALHAPDRALLVDFQQTSAVQLENDPWAACRVDLSPGPYRLAVTVATGDVFEMAVIALAGWQTQIFLLQRDDAKWGRGRRPDLASASVAMTRSHEFSKDAQENRLAELARLALVDGRQVISDELNQILHGKFGNPMLGIIGGHLLMRQKKPDLKALRIVVDNLRQVVFGGVPHPDVEALSLLLGDTPRCDFGVPPMLHAGWRIAVEHSLKKPALVPAGSWGARIATRVTNQAPWLIWRSPADEKSDPQEDYLGDFRQFVETAAAEIARVSQTAHGKGKGRGKGVGKGRGRIAAFAETALGKLGSRALDAASEILPILLAPSPVKGKAVDLLAALLAQRLQLPPATVSQLITQAFPPSGAEPAAPPAAKPRRKK